MLGLIGTRQGGRGYVFQCAFLPYPKAHPATARTIPVGDDPWAFVMIDGSSGYVIGRIWISGQVPFWDVVIDEVRYVCEHLQLAPKLIQLHPNFLFHVNAAQFRIRNIFKHAILQILNKQNNNVEDWVQTFIKYVDSHWKIFSIKEASFINLQTHFLDIIKQFNADKVNDGFPNFGEAPEDIFWNSLTKILH
ncbi:hypothetical protein [Geothrix sp. PMB-07]|uniref:hypothetical protein n=1 Tax=Geothrix sp. PMB-07 TaxID=3068640 RepID=UPI002741D920|nr:hypothetical protein [Geothrix sp. PMB-07]WLT32725.1 hypothetical protein Q9293_05180 [Geothrix sp. PMB-07]